MIGNWGKLSRAEVKPEAGNVWKSNLVHLFTAMFSICNFTGEFTLNTFVYENLHNLCCIKNCVFLDFIIDLFSTFLYKFSRVVTEPSTDLILTQTQ